MRRRLLIASIVTVLIAGACGEESGSSDTAAQPPATTASSTGGSLDAAAVTAGRMIFERTCVACHGRDAMGLPGLGKPLVANEFIAGLDDAEVVAFLRTGRPADHPDNTTGIAMPVMGGNTALTDQDLNDLVAFLRSLTAG